IENLQPHGFGFTDHDRVDMLQSFFDPVGNMWAAGHDRHTERAISIGQGIGAAREARKERQGNKIGRIVYWDRSDLLMKHFNFMLSRRERRQMDAGNRRHKIHEMAPTIAWSVADNDAYLHVASSRVYDRRSATVTGTVRSPVVCLAY